MKPLKKPKASDLLLEETKKMEERLKMIQDVKKKEDEAKKKAQLFKDGNHWRSSNKKKGVSNYSSKVLTDKKVKPPAASQVNFTGTKVESSEPLHAQTQEIPNKAAQNLQRALELQESEENFKELDDFLDSVKLKDKYRHVFIENGIQDLETILELNDEHLQIMKIPLGHKLKILKKIKEHSGSQSSSSNLQKPIKSAMKAGTSHHSQLVELNAPSQKVVSVSESGGGGALLQGTYNEAESHQSFKQALADWRGGSQQDPQQSPKKEVRFVDNGVQKKNSTPSKPGSFFANIGSTENWDVNCLPSYEEAGTGTSQSIKTKSEKESCWQCYKLFPKQKGLTKYNKTFCEEECFSKYEKANSIGCQNSFGNCKKTFLKINGLLKNGGWYCGQKCAREAKDALGATEEEFGEWGDNDAKQELPDLDL